MFDMTPTAYCSRCADPSRKSVSLNRLNTSEGLGAAAGLSEQRLEVEAAIARLRSGDACAFGDQASREHVVRGLIQRFHAHELLAVTVVAALPTAQNVFTFAVRYRQGEVLARDAIFVTTLGSVPVLLLIAGLLS